MKRNHTFILLILQIASVIFLVAPIMTRIEPNITTVLHSALQTFLTGNPHPASYSFVDTIGLSMILNAVIFTFLAMALCSLIVLILQLLHRIGEYSSMIVTVCSVGQSVVFALYGLLTTCTISTTLQESNVHFYLNSLLGSELYQSLDSISGFNLDSVLSGLYGAPYYDYWNYLRVTPLYFVALFVFIVIACTAVVFQKKTQAAYSL